MQENLLMEQVDHLHWTDLYIFTATLLLCYL